ncbi:hypothetical protein [Kitasatospora sp. MY 5-36]|uniref:hypothetical protein n=1 Tax=Kitasatospora sp. MY 5-36 TaxID=1678027 RepID=UPI0006710447|nr:hypothetical protein [Kitasatospora sp. MY 5-36]
MSDTLTRSRGAELLAGEFSEFAADLAADVAKENPDFSDDYIGLLVTAWADWATIVADDPLAGHALTVDMDEVWHAALRRTRKNFAFMSRLTGGRFIHHEPADNYGTPDKVRDTVAALIAAGYGAAPEVYSAADAAGCSGSDCRPAAPCPGGDVAPAFELSA